MTHETRARHGKATPTPHEIHAPRHEPRGKPGGVTAYTAEHSTPEVPSIAELWQQLKGGKYTMPVQLAPISGIPVPQPNHPEGHQRPDPASVPECDAARSAAMKAEDSESLLQMKEHNMNEACKPGQEPTVGSCIPMIRTHEAGRRQSAADRRRADSLAEPCKGAREDR